MTASPIQWLVNEAAKNDAHREALGVLEVARDLVEMGDVFEARCLLEELPDRHDHECPACGAYGAWPKTEGVCAARPGAFCLERALVTCRFCAGSGKRTEFTLVLDDDPPPQRIVRCTECYGTGQRDQVVDMLVPHESRLMGRR